MRSTTILALVACAACSSPGLFTPAPLSIEFGQDAYLTDAYLQDTPGHQCGAPAAAPRMTNIRSPLPDGSWFRVFALESEGGGFDTVALERGWEGQEAQLVMRLSGSEGIVRLRDRGREDAWGVNHAWGDWMRALGARASSLECAPTG